MWKKLIALLALFPMIVPGLYAQAADSIPSIEETIAHLPFEGADLEKLLANEIVSYELEAGTDKELAIVVAMLVRAPIDRLAELVLKGDVLRASADVIEVHFLGDHPPSEELFSGMGFTANESKEVAELRRVAPGSKFNLSKEEIEHLNSVAQKVESSGSADDPTVRNAINDAYRTILLERYKAFRQGGLGAIAPYDRGKKSVDPGEELRDKIRRTTLVKKRIPNFYRALLNYPDDGRDAIHNRFALIKKSVNDRPAYVLGHRMYQLEPGDYALYAYHEFYVGHSYNSLQIISGAVQVEQGTLVFYVNRTSTDQVAGFGGGLKRSIGRGMMRSAVVEQFESIRRLVE
ncbi:MAG: hypothetical protein O7C67_00415 [Gammaproteobacteria bacterium]|nr:hypothetical protein [Gammaproteobacteria bacterium]